MMTGLDDFKTLLREFNKLSLAVLGAGVVVPFAAALAALAPPWPPGIVGVTAIGDLIGLVIVFQYLHKARRRQVNRVVAWSALALLFTALAYFIALSEFVVTTPTSKAERIVLGFECTDKARTVYGSDCVALRRDQLGEARFEADAFWTRRSITAVRVGLLFGWLAIFFSLTVLLGSFLVFQSGQKGRSKEAPKPT
jgi:hypothetical protein